MSLLAILIKKSLERLQGNLKLCYTFFLVSLNQVSPTGISCQYGGLQIAVK